MDHIDNQKQIQIYQAENGALEILTDEKMKQFG
jgi:hypothetical protein